MEHDLPIIDDFSAPPDSVGSSRALSRIGYTLDEALADVIDNSIDADATRIEITFVRDDYDVSLVTIADDGKGMDDATLRQAMQFASTVRHESSDLGSFGLGMKSASLSQCSNMSVISVHDGRFAACRWTAEAIKNNWRCEVLDPTAASEVFWQAFSPHARPTMSGTVVVWDQLDRMQAGSDGGDLDEFLAKMMLQLEVRLGLTFHRFLARPRFGIVLRTRHQARSAALLRTVRPLDPFGYIVSGAQDYPRPFSTSLPGVGDIQLQAHIWPPGSVEANFLLGRRTATSHQGFYFYRNDRLIQGGGWSELIPDAADTELNLARVLVNLPPDGTSTNVQKSAIQVSAALSQALKRARCGQASLSDYMNDARDICRLGSRRVRAFGVAPLVIGEGLPIQLRRNVRQLIAKRGVVREIDFAWGALPDERLFDLDPINDRITLNAVYRVQILNGGAKSGTDAALIKSLLFLLLQDHFGRKRMSARRQEWMDQCNAILLEAVKSS